MHYAPIYMLAPKVKLIMKQIRKNISKGDGLRNEKTCFYMSK